MDNLYELARFYGDLSLLVQEFDRLVEQEAAEGQETQA